MDDNKNSRERSDSVKIFTSFYNYYELLDTRASGSFATVKVGRYSITGDHVAIKIVNKAKLDTIAIAHLASETSCLRLIKHPNVVKLYDLYESPSKLYLVMELGDGDLYQHIMNHYKDLGMPEDSVRYFFRQIVSAIDYCHKIHIVHRDLKPQNIIIFKSTNVVKLADFGFSRVCAPDNYLHTTCGSLPYTAPEVFLDESYDARKSDIWSIAVILFIMLTGQVPFDHVNQSEMLTMVLDCKYHLPSFISQEARDVISKMLLRNPDDRLSLSAIFMTPFFKNELEDSETFEGKTITISNVLHQYVISEIIQNKIATRSEVLKSLKDQKCDFISAAYHLIANDAFKKASSRDTINYILIADDNIIHEEYELFSKTENKENPSFNLVPSEFTTSNDDIFHQISISMEDVSLQCSNLHKSHSLRQPRKKMLPYKLYNQKHSEYMNGLKPVNNYSTGQIFCETNSIRTVSSKILKKESFNRNFKGKSGRLNSPGLHSLSELTNVEASNESNHNLKITSLTCLNTEKSLKKNPSDGKYIKINTSSNKINNNYAISNPDVVVKHMNDERKDDTKESSHVPSNNSTIQSVRCSHSVSDSSDHLSKMFLEKRSEDKTKLSVLHTENVICRTKSLNTKSKNRFINFITSRKGS